jgi:hypothetical protein
MATREIISHYKIAPLLSGRRAWIGTRDLLCHRNRALTGFVCESASPCRKQALEQYISDKGGISYKGGANNAVLPGPGKAALLDGAGPAGLGAAELARHSSRQLSILSNHTCAYLARSSLATCQINT